MLSSGELEFDDTVSVGGETLSHIGRRIVSDQSTGLFFFFTAHVPFRYCADSGAAFLSPRIAVYQLL